MSSRERERERERARERLEKVHYSEPIEVEISGKEKDFEPKPKPSSPIMRSIESTEDLDPEPKPSSPNVRLIESNEDPDREINPIILQYVAKSTLRAVRAAHAIGPSMGNPLSPHGPRSARASAKLPAIDDIAVKISERVVIRRSNNSGIDCNFRRHSM